MALQPTTTKTDSGEIHSILDTDTNQRGSVFISTGFGKGTALAEPAAGMFVGVLGASARVVQQNGRLLPDALREDLRATLPAIKRGPFNALRKAIGDYHASTEAVRADLMTPTPETPVTRPVRERALKLFDAADAPTQMKMAVRSFNLEQLSALVAADALSALPADVATAATDRFLAMRFAARQGLAAKYPVHTSAVSPVSIGVDHDAMMREANQFVTAMNANAQTVQDAIQICRDVSGWLGVACRYNADEAFAMLTKN